jgi:hypothetical protein
MSDFFDKLMKDEDITIIKEGGNVYGLRILSKGEDLFFRENDRGLICTIDAVHGSIFKDSIRTWDSHEQKMNKEEKERVLKLIYKFYKAGLNPDAHVCQRIKGRWEQVPMD